MYRLIEGLRAGDQHTAQEFCEEYGALLHRLAEKHLPHGLRRRVGPEDVVQSVCRTFLRRARDGAFDLADSDSLWRLLCAITLTKVREQTRFHLRRKRGLDREVHAATVFEKEERADIALLDPRPGPAAAAEFADQFQQIRASLDAEERQVVDLKLQECTNDEVAECLGCSERTVRRILKRVQSCLSRAFKLD